MVSAASLLPLISILITSTLGASPAEFQNNPPYDWWKELARQRQIYPTLPTRVDICADPNNSGLCFRNLAHDAGVCVNIYGKDDPNHQDVDNALHGTSLGGGISSIAFVGSTFCWLFDNDDCYGRRLVVTEGQGEDLRAPDFDDVMRSFACWRRN